MASTGEDPRLRNLRIKTGVFKRYAGAVEGFGVNFVCSLTREKAMYEKEVVDQEAVIEKLKARGEDEYVIRKQVIGRPRSVYIHQPTVRTM